MEKILTGQKLVETLPEECMELIKDSLTDFGLELEKDILNCKLYVTQRGHCFLKHKSRKDSDWENLIACFNLDGSGFYYGSNTRLGDNMRMNDERKLLEKQKILVK